MKSALDDPPRKVEGEVGVGLRERPLADSRARVHVAVQLPRSGLSWCGAEKSRARYRGGWSMSTNLGTPHRGIVATAVFRVSETGLSFCLFA